MESFNHIPFSQLFQEYIVLYLKEYGEKQAKSISDKVNNSNKCEKLLIQASRSKIRLGSDDFVATVLSSTSFSFSKAEAVSLASILLLYRWQNDIAIPNGIVDEDYLKEKFFRIIDKCDKLKTHVSTEKNFFEKFYEYLFNSFKDSQASTLPNFNAFSISLADRIFLIAKGGIVELKTNYKDLTNEGKFEVIILNTLIALETFYNNHPEKMPEIRDELYSVLVDQARTYGINSSTDTLVSFIKNRFLFYSNELELLNTDGYIPAKLYSAMYVNPLTESPEAVYDLGEIILFIRGFHIMINWIHSNTDQI